MCAHCELSVLVFCYKDVMYVCMYMTISTFASYYFDLICDGLTLFLLKEKCVIMASSNLLKLAPLVLPFKQKLAALFCTNTSWQKKCECINLQPITDEKRILLLHIQISFFLKHLVMVNNLIVNFMKYTIIKE